MDDSTRGNLHEAFLAVRHQVNPTMALGLAVQDRELAEAGYFGQDRIGQSWAELGENEQLATGSWPGSSSLHPVCATSWERAVPGP